MAFQEIDFAVKEEPAALCPSCTEAPERLADLLVAGRSEDHPVKPYIIAEIGVNHECSMEMAKRMIEEAAEAGAQAVKFQVYRAETLAVRNSPAYWDMSQENTPSQYQLFKKYDRFWKREYERLKKYCDRVGIEFLATPFDLESAKFLNDLVQVFKIASADITNHPFIEEVCRFGKPLLLSTGAADLDEIEEAVSIVRRHGLPYGLMHCILCYPTRKEWANLGMLLDLKEHFPDAVIGYSDHIVPDSTLKPLVIANLLGARVIEKHFTFDKSLPGNDHYHAMDKEDLKRFWTELDEIYRMLGSFEKRPITEELPSRLYARRSLVAARRIPAGSVIRREDLTWKRPGTGISPRDINRIVGKKAATDIETDEIVTWEKVCP